MMRAAEDLRLVCLASILLLLLPWVPGQAAAQQAAASRVVTNGFEFHAALTSPSITQILLGDNVTLSLETCPFPSSPAFPATILDRNVTISTAAGWQGPFWLDCGFLDARFTMTPGHTMLVDGLVLLNCRTVNTFGFVRIQQNATLILNNTVDFQGPSSVCIPLEITGSLFNIFPRPDNLPSPTGNRSQQLTAYAPAGSNWCTAAAAGQTSGSLPPLAPQFLPLLLANSSSSLCQQQAGLLGDFARTEPPAPYQLPTEGQPQEARATIDVLWMRSVLLCKQPLTGPCVGANATDACIAAAFRAVTPAPACPAFDAASLHTCLTTPSYSRILLTSDITLNASSTAFPPSMVQDPPTIGRNITLASDARGPRLVLDCALLADRVAVGPGVTVLVQHLVLSDCSIGAEKPLLFMRFSQGAALVLQDTFVLQPNNLCLPQQQQLAALSAERRSASVPGVQQSPALGQPSAWCAAGVSNATATASADSNTSYSRLPQVEVNATGPAPTYAATLVQPAQVAFYTHPTWPRHQLCDQQVLLLVDYAYPDPFAWSLPPNASQPAPDSPAAVPDSVNGTNPAQQQQQQPSQFLPAALAQRLGPGYNGTTLPVRYINSTAVCQQPSLTCTNTSTNGTHNPCLLAEYSRLDPDAAAGAGAGAAAGDGRNYGVSVVLPAVLASVGGALLLAGAACCVILARRRHHKVQQGGGKGPGVPSNNLMGVLFGTPAGTPSEPGRHLLQGSRHGPSPAATCASSVAANTTAGSSSTGIGRGGTDGSAYALTTLQSQQSGMRQFIPRDGRPIMTQEDITLSVLIGAGSFGKVYAGTWKDRQVAVKVINHSSADDVAISRELTLRWVDWQLGCANSLAFDSPNLVRTLHYARTRINADSSSLGGTPSQPGGSSMFVPQGAVGVFELPTDWAVVQQQTPAEEPVIDTETWIIMDLMDRGTLASAVRRGLFVADGTIKAGMLLRRLADVASGLCYLHAANVCHGDLKCENTLLRTEPQDPDGVMAAIADFGLSRALALGQSHLSTMRYGTVTHQPPELLVSGKLTPAADIYSFGIMMWEVVSQRMPFSGMHHGEVIHKVVTADLRPGPWPAQVHEALPPGYIALAEACWARQRTRRPSAQEVLQRLLDLLGQVEAPPPAS